jgi:PIN domain nuclease of toxin-antitoxin system
LLDTQIVIIAARTPERLSERARAALLDGGVPRYVSLVSLWEIVIKRGTGKLAMTNQEIDQTLADLAASELPIHRQHVLEVAALPFHHRDPFDRLLIAQAKAEDLIVVTRDRSFAAYGIRILPA